MGGNAFGTDPEILADVVKVTRKSTTLPLIPKLAPNVPNIPHFARVCEEQGSDAISLINSVPAMAIDIETRRPILANTFGGLTGPAIHPIAVKQVYEASQAVTIPIIGMGGIESAGDAVEFLIAGASAVAVGTASFYNPRAFLEVLSGIKDYMLRHGFKSVSDLTGSIER